jgi:hypothetical protein
VDIPGVLADPHLSGHRFHAQLPEAGRGQQGLDPVPPGQGERAGTIRAGGVRRLHVRRRGSQGHGDELVRGEFLPAQECQSSARAQRGAEVGERRPRIVEEPRFVIPAGSARIWIFPNEFG